jgi:hypothetical protein
MAEVNVEQEIRNPVHAALTLMLAHLAISQPEVSKETRKLKAALDDHFSAAKQFAMPDPIPGPQGPQGEKGEKGDRGEKGQPGDAGKGGKS